MDIFVKAGQLEDIAVGEEAILHGKVGSIVLAGGDGSRLGWDGPKGTYPISLVKQKTLFQLLYERVEAARKAFGYPLKFAVMTSPLNHDVTAKAFSHGVDFFTQNLSAVLDLNEQMLDIHRPNGNGEVLKQFYASGLYDSWKKSGVEYIQVILIDNPLAEPFDPNQIGVHIRMGSDITLKAVEKLQSEEKVGVIGKRGGKLTIVEYSDNPPKEWKLANTSLFSFSMEFVEKTKDIELPHHKIKKFLDQRPVYKQECFIFDLLTYAEKAEVILYPRELTFAPLKNRDDVGPVQRALLERDKRMISFLTGREPPSHLFELDAAFHYPTDALKKKWKGKLFEKESYLLP